MAEQACKDLVLRQERGLSLTPVTVNFSAQDFDYVDVPEELERIYNEHCPDLYPEKKYLVVEITEQDMAKATDKFLEQYLLDHTDDNHSVTTNELIRVYEENGFKANRDTKTRVILKERRGKPGRDTKRAVLFLQGSDLRIKVIDGRLEFGTFL